MRIAARAKARGRQQISDKHSVSSPVKGLNAYDALANMRPDDAVSLDNWYPRPSYCEIRGGSVSWATGMAGTAKTLAVYNSIAGTSQLFCATNSGVYNVSAGGAVGASVASRTNGKHQWLMFGDGTSNWLIMVNGVDKPLYYNGTTWTAVDGASSPALTGVTTTNLIGVEQHKGRLWFIEKATMNAWYLSSGVAGGALTKFDLSGVAQRGGYLMALSKWTVDAGSGPDDRLAFITSEGEIIVYEGTNPASAATWALVGVYYVGRPLGRRCFTKIGGDVLIITQVGIFALSSVLGESGINYNNAISRRIEKTFNELALTYGANYGWSATVYPAQTALVINVPIAEDGTHYQFVMNTIHKAWCRFLNWDAEDFVDYGGQLYYCQGTKVIKAWSGTNDQGSNIEAYAKCAFNYFGTPTLQKQFKLYRPMLLVNGSLSFLVDIDVDYSDAEITGIATYTTTSSGLWDVSLWDVGFWADGLQVVKEWATPGEWTGYCAASKLKIATNSLLVQWMSNDIVFESGGIL
jgi:hypothetical protein